MRKGRVVQGPIGQRLGTDAQDASDRRCFTIGFRRTRDYDFYAQVFPFIHLTTANLRNRRNGAIRVLSYIEQRRRFCGSAAYFSAKR